MSAQPLATSLESDLHQADAEVVAAERALARCGYHGDPTIERALLRSLRKYRAAAAAFMGETLAEDLEPCL